MSSGARQGFGSSAKVARLHTKAPSESLPIRYREMVLSMFDQPANTFTKITELTACGYVLPSKRRILNDLIKNGWFCKSLFKHRNRFETFYLSEWANSEIRKKAMDLVK